MEIWKNANHPFLKDKYVVSRDGRIKNILTGHILKPRKESNGYLRVGITDPRVPHKKSTHASVHRVVALTYIPNPENKPQVNHINGDKTDNRVENLEWVTESENQRHAYNSFLKARGDNITNSKISNAEAHRISRMYSDGYRIRDIAGRLFDDSISELSYHEYMSVISDIVRGHSWKFIFDEYPRFTGDRKALLVSRIVMLYKSGYTRKDIRHILMTDFEYVLTKHYVDEKLAEYNKCKGSTTIESIINTMYIHIESE